MKILVLVFLACMASANWIDTRSIAELYQGSNTCDVWACNDKLWKDEKGTKRICTDWNNDDGAFFVKSCEDKDLTCSVDFSS